MQLISMVSFISCYISYIVTNFTNISNWHHLGFGWNRHAVSFHHRRNSWAAGLEISFIYRYANLECYHLGCFGGL